MTQLFKHLIIKAKNLHPNVHIILLVFILSALIIILYLYYNSHYSSHALSPAQNHMKVDEKSDLSQGNAFDPLQPHVIMDIVSKTDPFGVVHENQLSDQTRQLISSSKFWQNTYMDYREKCWRNKADQRQNTRFDPYDYNPQFSALLAHSSAKCHNQTQQVDEEQ